MKNFSAIAAMDPNRVIGSGLKIPWHLPEDFKFFKATTMGGILLMGRRTFESIGRPLPGRETIVLSRGEWNHPGVRVLKDWKLHPWNREERPVFVCGGATLYQELLPYCDSLYLTHVHQSASGDVYFPPFESTFDPGEELLRTPDFHVKHYRNLQPLSL